MDNRQDRPLEGVRVKITDNGLTRYGTVTVVLSKEETRQCCMYGHLIKARMDDTGKEEEFAYAWEIEEKATMFSHRMM